ncbi:RGCVC family protein [Actinophytocola gossypii]|uniref:RGCVC family protein n=1 Tax=Actinophytocola gossypii TaxID=2812003 RepID=A0ABT2J348_9PSEU|nr:RGCVC family protein [Actinophytocola gossypii]MCT2582034.1 RGCVC family protein [Actinophytocola gossypii]
MPEVAVTPNGSETPDTTACAACPHPWPDHDRIAARFCTATTVGKLGRGCVCTADADSAG